MTYAKIGKIAWKVSAYLPSIASTRYRCYLPAQYLEKLGVHSRIYSGPGPLDLAENLKAVIFVKSFSHDDLKQAREAKRAGVPVVLDLCDNLFYRSETDASSEATATRSRLQIEYFREMAEIADLIVTTGSELSKYIRQEVGEGVRIEVVPDAAETEDDVAGAWRLRARARRDSIFDHGFFWFLAVGLPRLSSFLLQGFLGLIHGSGARLSRLCYSVYEPLIATLARLCASFSPVARQFISNRQTIENREIEHGPELSPLPRVVWFGNSGQAGLFGITDLLKIRSDLEAVNEKVPFQLVVISNSRAAYRRYIKPFGLKTSYLEWSPRVVRSQLKNAKAVIVPNPKNAFSICKSANRALLALQKGVPVVATRTSALADFDSCVQFDDWQIGLFTYLTDSAKSARDVSAAKTIIAREFSGEAIARRWLELLDQRV